MTPKIKKRTTSLLELSTKAPLTNHTENPTCVFLMGLDWAGEMRLRVSNNNNNNNNDNDNDNENDNDNDNNDDDDNNDNDKKYTKLAEVNVMCDLLWRSRL